MMTTDRAAGIPLIDCSQMDNVALARRCSSIGMLAYATTLEAFLAQHAMERPEAVVAATSDPAAVHRLRRATPAPLIVIDYAPSEGAAVKLLASGADDYVAAPCEHDEVVARIVAVLRRTQRGPVTVHDLTFDPATRVVRRGGKTIALTPTENAILAALAENRDTILSREELVRLAAQHGARVSANSLPVAVHHLRKKIDATFGEPLLHCIPFSGYLFGRYREGLPRARAMARKVAGA